MVRLPAASPQDQALVLLPLVTRPSRCPWTVTPRSSCVLTVHLFVPQLLKFGLISCIKNKKTYSNLLQSYIWVAFNWSLNFPRGREKAK